MSYVLLLLRSRLLRDALASVLAKADFLVLSEVDVDREARPPGNGSNSTLDCVLIDPVAYASHSATVHTYQARGWKLVLLATGAAALLHIPADQLASADGILTHNIPADTLIQSLRLVCSGQRVIAREMAAPSVLAPVATAATPNPESGPPGRKLTLREEEVLSALAEGHGNKAIASMLGLAEATVKVHLKSLLRKINAENRTQAAVWALSKLSNRHRGFV